MSEHAEPKKRPGSIKNDRSYLTRHILPALGKQKVKDVSSPNAQKLHNGLRATPYQANRVLALMSKLFSLAVRWDLRSDNPAQGIERFHEERRHRWLSDAELARLTDALASHSDQTLSDAIRLQLLTGTRIGEVLTLMWEDIDLERGVWTKASHHTKQKRTEHLRLSKAACELLMRKAARKGAISQNPRTGKPYKDIRRFWASVTKAARLQNDRIHDIRHTHTSHLGSSGLSLAILGRLLGHTNPITTQRYALLADDPLREAVEIMGRKLQP